MRQLWVLVVGASCVSGLATPSRSVRELVQAYVNDPGTRVSRIGQTTRFAAEETWAETIRFKSAVGSGAFSGARALAGQIGLWERACDSELPDDFASTVCAVASVAPNEVLVRWNATWTPPQTEWLKTLAALWPGVVAAPTPYVDKCRSPSTFSWRGVANLFGDAATTGRLRVPLATVEGRSTLASGSQKALRCHFKLGVFERSTRVSRTIWQTSQEFQRRGDL